MPILSVWAGLGKVKFNLISASRTLYVLLKPSSETIQVENVAAFELFSLLDLLKTNDAGTVNSRC